MLAVPAVVIPDAEPAGASPSWSYGVSDVAPGFSFVAPFDAAMSATQRYVFVLDDQNRVVKVDTNDDTASVLTLGDEIGTASRIAVDGATGDVVVSAYSADDTDARVVVVDHDTGDQTVLASSTGRPGPVAFDAASGRILTTIRSGDFDRLVSIDPAGAVTDLGRPVSWRDYTGVDISDILVDPWGRITVAASNAYCGLYFYEQSLWAYNGTATAPGSFVERTELWMVGRSAMSPTTGMLFAAGGRAGAWDANDTERFAVMAFPSAPAADLAYFGPRAYRCSDASAADRAPKAQQPLLLAGGANRGNATGVPGSFNMPGGIAVQAGYAGAANPTQVFVTDPANNRLAVVVPRKILGFPSERYGGLMSAGSAGDPIDPAFGNFHDSHVDLEAAGGAFGMSVVRGYNSGDPGGSTLGVGWRAPFSQTLRADVDGSMRLVVEDGRNVVFHPNHEGGWMAPTEFAGRLVGSPPTSVAFPNGETWQFDPDGNLSAMSNWDGQAVVITRTAAGPSLVTSTTGATVTFDYDAVGRLAAAHASDGRSVAYSYDHASGSLSSVTAPDGGVTTVATNTSGQVVTITDPSGVVLASNTYDVPGGRVVAQTNPEGTETYAYDDASGDTTVTFSASGETFVYHHDEMGRMVGVTDGAAHTSTRTYDANGWVASGTDRANVSGATAFDEFGNPTVITEPGAGTTTMAYDAAGRMTSKTSPVSGTTTYGYNGTDRIPSTITDALGQVTQQVVADGHVISNTDPDGVTTTYTYDQTTRRLIAVTDGAGKTATFGYDAAGRVTRTTSPEGREATTTYDAVGRVLSTTAPDGGVTTMTYDGAGKVLTVTDPTGAVTTNTYQPATGLLLSTAKPGHAPTQYEYDGFGQPTKVTDPTGESVETTFGVLGRVESTKDSAGRVTRYAYTATGELASVTAADGGVTTTGYDVSTGRRSTVTDAAARTTTTTYRANGLVDRITAPGGGVTTFGYDALGRVVSVTDPTNRVTRRAYTAAGRTASETDAAGVVTTFGYDSAGRLHASTTPAGTTTIAYSDDGYPASTTTPTGLVSAQTYDLAGRPARFTDPAGVSTTQTWSLRGELLSRHVSGRGTERFTYAPDGTMSSATDARGNVTNYSYDAAGRLVGRATPVGSESWGYDHGEMSSYTPPILGGVPRPMTFGRDAAGRVNSVRDGSGRTRTDTFNPAGDLTSSTYTDGATSLTNTFAYDAAGRQNAVSTAAGLTTRTFDAAGRMTSSNQPDGRFTQYSYDNGGRRRQLTTPEGVELVYGYDAAGRLATITPNATMTDWFTGDNGAGPDPNKWTRQYSGGGTAAIDGLRLRLTSTAAGSSAAVTSKSTSAADVSTTVSFRVASTATAASGTFEMVVRRDTTGANSYRVQLPSGSTTGLVIKRVGGVDTQIGTFALPTAGSEIRVQFEVAGSTVRAKAWPAGGSAPTSWGVSVTDSSVTGTGAVQLQWTARGSSTNSVSLDNFRQRNDPSVALTPYVTYTYDADGRVTGEALPGGSRGYTYSNGRLTREVQSLPGADRTTDLTYHAAGAIATTSVAGGATVAYTYDAAGQLTAATPTSGPALTYGYDGAGRRTSSAVGGASTTYAYNAASQLISATPSSGPATTYTYDGAGRRVGQTSGGDSVGYSYNPAGQLTNVVRSSGGSVTRSESRAYNAEGLLRRDNVTDGAGAFVRYLKFDWDSATNGDAQMVSWLDGESNLGLVGGPGGMVATTKGNAPTAVAQDVFGNVVNSTGQVAANAASWDPFGNAAGAASTDIAKLGFRGELTLYGETYLRARTYQASSGQFTTVDPLDDVAGSPTSGNRYHYAYNDAVNRVDPSGMRPTDIDADLGLCRKAGGFGLVAFEAQDGAQACLMPPVTRTDGAQCRPPFDSNGNSIVYSRAEKACGTVSTEVTCAHGAFLPLLNRVCRNADTINAGLGMVAELAGGVACSTAAAPLGPVGVGMAGAFCAGLFRRAAHAASLGYSASKTLQTMFDPNAMARDLVVGAAIGAATGVALRVVEAVVPAVAKLAGITSERAAGMLDKLKAILTRGERVAPEATEGAISPTLEANGMKFIYGDRVLGRAVEEAGPLHNFPATFDETILSQGTRTVVSDGYVEYTLPGRVNGVDGVYEIGTRPTALGDGEVITHRFFRPGG